MEKVLKGLQWQTLRLYLDDILIFFKDLESHLEQLAEVCQHFFSARLKLHSEKCQLFQREVPLPGLRGQSTWYRYRLAKISVVKNWKTPQCTKKVKSFLGFVGYYRKFCPDFAPLLGH